MRTGRALRSTSVGLAGTCYLRSCHTVVKVPLECSQVVVPAVSPPNDVDSEDRNEIRRGEAEKEWEVRCVCKQKGMAEFAWEGCRDFARIRSHHRKVRVVIRRPRKGRVVNPSLSLWSCQQSVEKSIILEARMRAKRLSMPVRQADQMLCYQKK